MSATDTQGTTTEAPGEEHPEAHHPTPAQYVQIAIILGILTALEVSTYFIDFGAMALPLLIVLMAIKFALVAGWFMHLKFDTRVFTRFMAGGLALATVLYATTLLLFAFGHFAYA